MPRFLAIDWDQNQLHVVAADVRGGSIKVQRAAVWQEQQSPNATDAEALGKLLRERLKEADIAPAPVLVCVGRDRVIFKDIRHPPVPEAEEAGLVRFQAVKELTEPPDEVIIDYTPVGDRKQPGERRALALIVRRDILAMWRKIGMAAGLKIEGLTPRPFGISACLRQVMGTTALTPAPSPPDSAVAVAVIGERWAEFAVIRGDMLLLARTLAVGSGLAGEIRRNLAVHSGQAGQQPVAGLYLTGNVTPDLRQRLADMLPDTPLHPFDPFITVELPEVAPVARGTFAGVVGLLYAKASRAGLPINFVEPRQPKPPANNRRQLVLGSVLGVVVFFGGGGFLSYTLNAHARINIENARRETDDAEAQLVHLREENKRFHAVDDWETPVVLDELYDLVSRVDITKLRISQVTMEPVGSIGAKGVKTSRYSAKMTIKGTMVDRNGDRKALNDMINAFTKDGYYSPDPPKVTQGNTFTVTVNVERRAPTKYERKLEGL